MSKTAVIVWHGPDALKSSLVAIDSLEPFPDNPRRGDVEAVRRSLRRFGQARPIVVFGNRIVAGHHVVLAAVAEGWTHVAVVPNDFKSEEEARAYLLADNRTAELGSFDDVLLLDQLRAAAEQNLEGTGYDDAYIEDLERRLAEAFAEDPVQPQLDERTESTDPTGFAVTLHLGRDDRRDFAQRIRMLEREWGVKGVTDVVVRAVRDAALSVA